MSENMGPSTLAGRSRIRQRILDLLSGEPGQRRHLREIARLARTSAGTASRELNRLLAAGVIERSVEGRQVYFQAKPAPSLVRTAEAPARYGAIDLTSGIRSGSPRPDSLGLAIARVLAHRLTEAYGDRLRGVYLYGSRARGDHDRDSDVDILIVLDTIEGYGRDLRLSSTAVADLSLASGLSISRVLASESSWRRRDRPFLRAVAADAVAV